MSNTFKCYSVLLVALAMASFHVTGSSGSFLDDLKSKTNEVIQSVSEICLTHDGCNKNFWELNNYCCLQKAQCCSYVVYIFQDDKIMENFKETIKFPRAINIILLVVVILVFFLIISAILSCISYFVCGCAGIICCCGQRKYTIVSRG